MSVHELPGIPDLLDHQLGLTDLPALPDLQIAPLRNPDRKRHNDVPVPLEPLAKSLSNRQQRRDVKQSTTAKVGRSSSGIKPSDVLSAREAKKPHLAISELVDTNEDGSSMLQLPSFVSLSVVEKSPIPHSSQINPHKRPRLENELETGLVEMNRVLPRPSKKDDKIARPVPLLPAMVTGLHEPPPSAGLLPSISDARPQISKTTSTSKMDVKQILAGGKRASTGRPPETMLNSPNGGDLDRAKHSDGTLAAAPSMQRNEKKDVESNNIAKESRSRRQYHKWTDQETADLVAGVDKYGIGKWKQILHDPMFNFGERSAVDLKDRYRVILRDSQNPLMTVEEGGENQDRSNEINEMETTSTASKHRKKRQKWTLEEDATLMAGVSKHGFQWSAIHADPDMQWGNRRPTDLRDRIRTLFPEGYKRADTKPFAKERDRPGKSPNESHNLSIVEGRSTSEKSGSQGAKRPHTSSDKQQQHVRQEQALNELVAKSTTVSKPRETKDSQQLEHAGVTLPSLALGDDDMEWDNRLPPLLDWEEI